MHINSKVIFFKPAKKKTSTRKNGSSLFMLPTIVVVGSNARQNHQRRDSFLPLTFKRSKDANRIQMRLLQDWFETVDDSVVCALLYDQSYVHWIGCRHSIRFIMTCCPLFTSLDISTAPQPCIDALHFAQKRKLHRWHFPLTAKPFQWRCDKHAFSARAKFTPVLQGICVNHAVVSVWVCAQNHRWLTIRNV